MRKLLQFILFRFGYVLITKRNSIQLLEKSLRNLDLSKSYFAYIWLEHLLEIVDIPESNKRKLIKQIKKAHKYIDREV